MSYYLGLDNGGTTTKAAIFSSDGHELGVARAATAAVSPRPGFVERDMEEMWLANCKVIRDVLEKTGISAGEISGVGICGHGKGLYLWGKDNRPARAGIISTDNRAYAYPLRWASDGTQEKAFSLTCQHILACQPVSLLAWIRDNEPETFSNIRWVFECKDYIRFRLTGEARAEITDYSGTSLLNLHTRSYDPRLLELFGLEQLSHALPPLCLSADVCGRVSSQAAELCGLKAGTPVIGGMFDIDACALSVGVTDESNICMIAGTWSINEYLRRAPVTDGRVLMNSIFCIPEYYLIEESSPTSAGNNEWFITQLLPEVLERARERGQNAYAELDTWVESIGPAEFVPVFLPFLMGSNAHPNAKGTFLGISANHTRKHLLRSVYEGIAFCHRVHMDKLLLTRAAPPSCVRLAGGAAHSRVWTQMFADVLGLPVETVLANETGALGCAVAVAAALGDYPDLKSAASNMCSIAATVYPDPHNMQIYDKKYDLYKKSVSCLDGLWNDMQILIEEN